MYQIYIDDVLLYDSRREDWTITAGEIENELNKSGSFTFTIYPDHPAYDYIVKFRTHIEVTKNGELIFRGRAIDDSDEWNRARTFTCEGELGFLNDSLQRPFTMRVTPAELFKFLISEHNAQVDEWKRFEIGTITVTGEQVDFETDNYENTFETVSNTLIDTYGGYLFVTENKVNGARVLNWFEDMPYHCKQSIEFGVNLLDLTSQSSAQDIKTALVPIGATVEDVPVTIASVNGGKDYIVDDQAVERYGMVFGTNTWSEIEDPEELLKTAKEYLTSLINQSISIDLNAIDMSILDRSIESFKYGQYVTCISRPHDLNVDLLITQQKIDLLRPDNDSITIGRTYESFTERTARGMSKADLTKHLSDYVKKSEVSQIENEIKITEHSLVSASGFTKTDGTLIKQGSNVKISITVVTSNALTSGSSYTIANLSEQTRPKSSVVALGFTDSTSLFKASVNPDGTITVTPESNILAGANLIIKADWIV